MSLRIGLGYDSHVFSEERDLMLAGVCIPYTLGLLGHSDADVVVHAIIDSIFGALACGDIGTHFPDTDSTYKNISSIALLLDAVQIMNERGYKIVNNDTTIICERPKLAPYILDMRKNLASNMNTDLNNISIKAKTNEGMDAVGNGNGICVHSVILLEHVKK